MPYVHWSQMRAFLNVPPIVLIKCLHTIVVCFPTCSYSEQVEDIELYNASIGGEFDAKMNSIKHIK